MAAAEAGADGVAAHAKLVLVALLGAGQFAQKSQAPALLKLSSPRVRIAAVYSRSEDRARQLAGWVAEQPAEGGSCREGDPQGAPVPDVYWDEGGPDRNRRGPGRTARPPGRAGMPTPGRVPAHLRAAPGRAALPSRRQGRPQRSKPIAGSLAEARELVAGYAALGSGRPLWGVAENYRLEPGMVRLAQACRELGAVHSLRFTAHQVVAPWNDTPWRLAPEYDGGYLLDAGVHFVAAMRLVLGDVDLSTVRATVQRRREVLAGPDQFAASFAFRSGALGMLEAPPRSSTPPRGCAWRSRPSGTAAGCCSPEPAGAAPTGTS
ncbi:unnamed protein product [Prorocentrum cordatum]|uniref:GFO/IDH/MocA-like oxidoreductase domain-containing protein n=1 Tax=Prorocentrum cordatum TaxID=2364126 RepID=A0ABN9S5J9_9DINO|nr:unnamed protein product [Polarella glacialis]